MAPKDIIGSVAPDLEVDVVGRTSTVLLSSLRSSGGILVVDFFAPWCKTCPAKAQELEKLAGSEYGQNCAFVLVCVDGGVDAAQDFAATHGIERCIIAAVVDEDAPSELFHVKGLPHCAIVDSNGILARNYEVDLLVDIEACLKSRSNGYDPPEVPVTTDL